MSKKMSAALIATLLLSGSLGAMEEGKNQKELSGLDLGKTVLPVTIDSTPILLQERIAQIGHDPIARTEILNRLYQGFIGEANYKKEISILRLLNLEDQITFQSLSSDQIKAMSKEELYAIFLLVDVVQWPLNFKGVIEEMAMIYDSAVHQNILGMMYRLGKGYLQDYVQAKELYQKAAESGLSEAMMNLATGMIYPDDDMAKKFEILVEKTGPSQLLNNGDSLLVTHAKILSNLANNSEARQLITNAAKQGYSLAQLMLYSFSAQEDNIEIPNDSQYWLLKAAKNGHPGAQVMYGQMLEKQSLMDDALYWTRQAANNGDTCAQLFLGLRGIIGEENTIGHLISSQEAKRWLLAAANQGVDQAQLLLAFVYMSELEVPRNKEEAIKWLNIVIDQGGEFCKSEALEMLNDINGIHPITTTSSFVIEPGETLSFTIN